MGTSVEQRLFVHAQINGLFGRLSSSLGEKSLAMTQKMSIFIRLEFCCRILTVREGTH